MSLSSLITLTRPPADPLEYEVLMLARRYLSIKEIGERLRIRQDRVRQILREARRAA